MITLSPTGQTIIGTMGLWSGRSRDFMDVLGIFVETDPTWSLWILAFHSTMGTTGARRFRKVSKVPIMFLSSRDQASWILSWPSIWGRRLCHQAFWPKCAPCQGSRTLAPFLWIWDRSKSAGAPWRYPQSQVYGLGVWRESHQVGPRMNFRSCASCLSMQAVSWRVMTWWRSSGIADFFIDDNTLSVNVARLRKKLEEAGLSNFIETKKGIGYGLTHE